MTAEGTVHRYGDHIDTDVIIPARYLNRAEPEFLASHCMEDLDASFSENCRPGDILVAGKNFGCGSSREHAPLAIKSCGISCVIACDFARIFYRNSINIGLPILECPEAAASIRDGDRVRVDFSTGTITDLTTGESFTAKPFPPFIEEIIAAGGLLPSIQKQMAEVSHEKS